MEIVEDIEKGAVSIGELIPAIVGRAACAVFKDDGEDREAAEEDGRDHAAALCFSGKSVVARRTPSSDAISSSFGLRHCGIEPSRHE
jgi:hypothetical protein